MLITITNICNQLCTFCIDYRVCTFVYVLSILSMKKCKGFLPEECGKGGGGIHYTVCPLDFEIPVLENENFNLQVRIKL